MSKISSPVVTVMVYNQEVMLKLVKIFAEVLLDLGNKSTKLELVQFIESSAEKLSLSDKERSLLHLDKKEALVKKAEEMWQRFESTGRLTKPTLVIKVDKSDLLALHMYSDHDLPVYKELNAALRNWESKDPKVKPEDRQKAEEVIFKLKTYILRLSKTTVGLPG